METIQLRTVPLNDAELLYVMKRFLEEKERVGSKVLKELADTECIFNQLQLWNNSGQLRVFEDLKGHIIGLLAFDVGTSWWSNKTILVEQFIFCPSPTYKGFGRVAVEELSKIADYYKVDAIMSGCAFAEASQLITNLYKKEGYTNICPTYVKFNTKG